MQKYKEINGNDYVKNSRTTINETMQSIQSMNSGTAFPTNNLFEGMKCYRTDLKKTYTLTDVENNTWVEDAHATLSDEATHAASATKLDTARSLNLVGAVTADAATFDGTANATINVKTLDATKLNGTASVSTTGNAATATKVVTTAADGASANIAEASMASNDLARIRVSGTTNAGELALETADDGSEPIVARQYTGVYTTPVRTAKILDESGNTSFPGTVVAPKFTGSLNGNAATASQLASPRTLSLTGKAAGSTSFDGSANASINVTSVDADTASKLSTARKINITGNASGAATFDGTSDVSINVSVSQAANADSATADKYGTDIADNYVRKYVNVGEQDLNNFRYGGLYCNPMNSVATSARHYPENEAGSLLVLNNGANGVDGCTQIYTTYATHDSYKREYDVASKTWSDWRKYAFEDSTVARALVAYNLNSGASTGSITINQSGYSDYSPTVGGNYANMNINSWFGVSFTSQCGGTVPKGKTAVGIDCREGIVRARSFEGALNGTATNADTVDGVHAASLFYHKGNWDANNWATIGTYQVNNNPPVSDVYPWGQVISSSTNNGRFQLYASHENNNGRLRYRTGWDNDKSQPWNTILDSENYNSFAPTKTGGGASGTWGINISGNAAGLSGDLVFPGIGDTGVSRKVTWNGSTDGADIYYQTTASDQGNLVLNLRDDANCYLRIAANGAFKSYFSPSDGNFHGNVNGTADSATNADNATKWNGIIDDHETENNTATWIPVYVDCKMQHTDITKMTVGNADKLDGYHASDIINKISAANTGGIVAASLTENGYVKFANGLILQWGYYSNGNNDWRNCWISFPVAFPNKIFCVQITERFSNYDGDFDNAIQGFPSLSGFNIRYRTNADHQIYWFAMGC